MNTNIKQMRIFEYLFITLEIFVKEKGIILTERVIQPNLTYRPFLLKHLHPYFVPVL